ncbi:MAG: hypothetical protein AVDCRST_MAG10-1880, partial [uncultured Acidimicrobiales bacterium]
AFVVDRKYRPDRGGGTRVPAVPEPGPAARVRNQAVRRRRARPRGEAHGHARLCPQPDPVVRAHRLRPAQRDPVRPGSGPAPAPV